MSGEGGDSGVVGGGGRANNDSRPTNGPGLSLVRLGRQETARIYIDTKKDDVSADIL